MARPKKEINENEVLKLATYGCTNTEIADFFGVSESTIRGRFCEIITKGHSRLKQRLRKAQINFALKGNPTLLVWLGKQYLDQKDQKDVVFNPNDLPDISFEFIDDRKTTDNTKPISNNRE